MGRDYEHPEYMEYPVPEERHVEVEPTTREEVGRLYGPKGEVVRRIMDRPEPGYRRRRDEWRR